MPRVSGAEVIRALQRLGFDKARQSGSHVVMRRGGKGCVVPLHAELKVATLAGIGRPVLALFGDDSSTYPLDRRIALDDAARKDGLTLELYPVPGAGTELFDVRAGSFYAPAYDEALARLEAFLRAPVP